MSRRHHVGTLERRGIGVFDSNAMSSNFRSHHVASCHITSHHVTSHHITSRHVRSRRVTSQHRNVATFWVWSNVATLDTNIATLMGFPATKKLQKSNRWDFYTLPSCSFFILTILDDLMTNFDAHKVALIPLKGFVGGNTFQ